MSFIDRVTALTNRFYGAIRHPDARRAVEAEERARDLTGFEGEKYCLLTTYKRSGEPVPTPVWFAVADGKLYVRTEAKVAKVKRVRNNSRVLVGPCTARGKSTGPMAEGVARILPPDEEEQAECALRENYGLFRKAYEGTGKTMNIEAVYLEISLVGAP